jgi:hypothetical protein
MLFDEQSSLMNEIAKKWFFLCTAFSDDLYSEQHSEEQHSRVYVTTVQFRRALVCIPKGGFQTGNSPVSWQIKSIKKYI